MPLNIPLALLLPIVMVAVFFIAIARFTLHKSHPELPDVVRFVRKLDLAELSELLDPDQEWALRNLCGPQKFRCLQRERIRLAFEYLRRLGHNAEIIQSWAIDLRETLNDKPRRDFTLHDHMICELVKVSTDLRFYSFMARVKVALWLFFKVHLWPLQFIPRVADLRIIGKVDVLKHYRGLLEGTAWLSLEYGEKYSAQLLNPLS